MSDAAFSESWLVEALEQHFRAEGPVEVTETTKSWVFLTRDRVFKMKKRVRDDLQDLTPLRARHDNTLTEIDLNRRLATSMYLGAVRVGCTADGRLALDDPGAKTLDWLVKMRRLPAEQMLDARIGKASERPVLEREVDRLVPVLTEFYRDAATTRLTAAELVTVQEDQLEMARQVLLHPKFAAHHSRVRHILDRLEAQWPALTDLLSQRVRQGAVVECHGDMRPEHVCLIDPPVIYDCLEFNRTLRLADPFSEMVFLGMECAMLGAEWIGPRLIAGLQEGLGTGPDPALLHFYEGQHAVVRARLCLAHLLQPVPRTPEKWMPLGLRYLDMAERRIG